MYTAALVSCGRDEPGRRKRARWEKGGEEGIVNASWVGEMTEESAGEVRTGREERTRPNIVVGGGAVV